MHRIPAVAIFTVLTLVLSFGAMACDSGSSARAKGGVTIEPLASSTAAVVPTGGKPADPAPTPTVGSAPTTPTEEATSAPAEDPTSTATAEPAAPLASDGSSAPTDGRWIDVDVATFVVRLMDGARVTREIGPVGVGVQVDTGEYASTQTGLFHIYNKVEDLVYDPPYDTYISHWVGFDPDKANGFHSFLKDATGKVVDPRTGRISNGCIRTGAPDVVYAFAVEGMAVWVHR